MSDETFLIIRLDDQLNKTLIQVRDCETENLVEFDAKNTLKKKKTYGCELW